MNIYLLSRTDDVGYDQYDAFVVAANNEDEAKKTAEANNYKPDYPYNTWRSAELVDAELVGTTDKYDTPTVILSSFNPG